MGDVGVKCILGILATVLTLGGLETAAAEEIGPVSSPLEPMVKPDLHVGAKKTWQNKKGEERIWTLVAMDETTASFEDGRGCTETTLHDEFTTYMALKWDCGDRSGSGTTELVKGDPWPLATGKKWRYKHAGRTSKGRKWKGKHTCKVKEEVRVSVPAGEFDTYHIECRTKYTQRDYYIAPSIRTTVLYEGKHLRGRWPKYVYKMVSYDPGQPD